MAAGSLLKPFASLDLNKAPLRSEKSDRDAATALRETVEAIWTGKASIARRVFRGNTSRR
jgi:hypothetical protein